LLCASPFQIEPGNLLMADTYDSSGEHEAVFNSIRAENGVSGFWREGSHWFHPLKGTVMQIKYLETNRRIKVYFSSSLVVIFIFTIVAVSFVWRLSSLHQSLVSL